MKLALPFLAAALLSSLLLSSCSEQSPPPAAGTETTEPGTPDSGQAAVFVKNVDPAEAHQLVQSEEDLIVLDVRTPAEFAEVRIAGATNVDFQAGDFETKLADLDKDTPYLVHCASGGRSAKSRELMKNLGFTQIYHLEGGIKAWQKADKPVEQSTP